MIKKYLLLFVFLPATWAATWAYISLAHASDQTIKPQHKSNLNKIQQADREKIYIIGVVPQFEAKRLRTIWNPIIKHLSKKTGLTFKLIGSPNMAQFEKEFLQGKFDFVYMNPFHFILAQNEQQYIPLVRDHGKALEGIIVTNKNSHLKDLSELKGKTIALPSPNSLGASLQIHQELNDDYGIEINPIYVKTHDSVYLNVILGTASAGGGVIRTFNKQAKAIKDGLKIIHTTKSLSPHPFAAHPNVSKKIVKVVQQVFLQLDKTSAGKKLLAAIPIKKIGIATLNDYQQVKALKLERFTIKP